MKFITLLLLAWSLACMQTATIHAEDRTIVLDGKPSIELSGHMDQYDDFSGKMTLTDILAQKTSKQFRPLPGNLNDGYGRKSIWVRFTLLRTPNTPENSWLRLYPPYLDYVDIYIQTGNNPTDPSSYQRIRRGDHIPIAEQERSTINPNFIIPLALPQEKPVTVYLRIHTTSSLTLLGNIHSQENLNEYTFSNILFHGAYLGIMIMIFVMNLIFFIRIRDKLYLYFSLFNLSMAIHYFAREGVLSLVFPSVVHLLSDYLVGLWIISVLLFSQVARHFFKTVSMPWIHRFLILTSIISCLAMLSIPLNLFSEAAQIMIFFTISLFLISIWLYYDYFITIRGGRIFLTVLSLNSLGVVIHFMQLIGYIPYNWWSIHNIEIATLINTALMAIALSKRMHIAEMQVIELAKESERRALGLARDMTIELEKNKKSLEVALESERQTGERKSRFLSILSHEYRTPLAIIHTNLELMELDHSGQTPGMMSKIDKMKRAVNRLVEILNISLQRSRLSDAHEQESFSHIQIAAFIENEISDLQALWPERTIIREERIAPHTLWGEYHYLKTALFNLVDNARKYSPPDSVIKVSCHKEGIYAVIRVHNQTDYFINPAEKELLFEKYQRGSNSTNTTGAGIGLWLVLQIIEQHHGMITIETARNEFVTTVHLPLDSPDESES